MRDRHAAICRNRNSCVNQKPFGLQLIGKPDRKGQTIADRLRCPRRIEHQFGRRPQDRPAVLHRPINLGSGRHDTETRITRRSGPGVLFNLQKVDAHGRSLGRRRWLRQSHTQHQGATKRGKTIKVGQTTPKKDDQRLRHSAIGEWHCISAAAHDLDPKGVRTTVKLFDAHEHAQGLRFGQYPRGNIFRQRFQKVKPLCCQFS